MKSKIVASVFAVGLACCAHAGAGDLESCRRHATPANWCDDMILALKTARAEGKDLFVFFPLYYDEVSINGKKFSSIKAWTNPDATRKLSESHVLVFYPWDYKAAIGGKLSPQWKKVHDFTGGRNEAFVILAPDGSLVWKHFGATDMALECEGEGLAFATKRLPELKKVLKRYDPVRRKADLIGDEELAAKELFGVLGGLDYAFAKAYFEPDIERMVKADKKGALGIREKYPCVWLLMPLAQMRTDFWNARNSKIAEIQKADRTASRKEAALKATIAMRKEWEPKFRKLLQVAEKVVPKLFDEGDRNHLNWLKHGAETHLKVWSGELKEIPGF